MHIRKGSGDGASVTLGDVPCNLSQMVRAISPPIYTRVAESVSSCDRVYTVRHAYTSSRQRRNNVFTLIFDQQLEFIYMVIMCTLCSLHYVIKYVISCDYFKQISAVNGCVWFEERANSRGKYESLLISQTIFFLKIT